MDAEEVPAFITPAGLPGPSGGTRYNQQILKSWKHAGFGVHHRSVPGAWPDAAVEHRRELGETLAGHRRVLVDGMIASAAPAELSRAAQQGCEISVLVHLPLPAESGLTTAQQRRLAQQEADALRTAHTVVATSQWSRENLRHRYGLTDVQVVIPGNDPAPPAPGTNRPPGGAGPQILFLGALTPRKNPLLLVNALGENADRPWHCVIAGPGDQDPDYAQRVASACAHYQERFALPGAVEGRSLEALWHGTDLLVLPSRTETYGMVVTEAIARGIPAIVGQGTGAEEALRGSPSAPRAKLPPPGAVADPGHQGQWTSLLEEWLSEPQLRMTWRDHALTHRVRLPGWNQAAKNLVQALQW